MQVEETLGNLKDARMLGTKLVLNVALPAGRGISQLLLMLLVPQAIWICERCLHMCWKASSHDADVSRMHHARRTQVQLRTSSRNAGVNRKNTCIWVPRVACLCLLHQDQFMYWSTSCPASRKWRTSGHNVDGNCFD